MTDELQTDELRFDDLTPTEVPVYLAGKSYILREASGDAACKYRNAMLACTRLGPDGKPSSIQGMADIEPLLVSMCLYNAEEGDKSFGKCVPLNIIRSWPSRVQKSLYDKVKEISEIGEEDEEGEEEPAKNELKDTEVGSD